MNEVALITTSAGKCHILMIPSEVNEGAVRWNEVSIPSNDCKGLSDWGIFRVLCGTRLFSQGRGGKIAIKRKKETITSSRLLLTGNDNKQTVENKWNCLLFDHISLQIIKQF